MWHPNERKFFYFIRKFFYFTFFMVISLSVISFILLGNSFILLGNYFILLLFGFYAFLCDTMGLKTILWWYYIFTMKSYYMKFSFLLLSITNFGKFLSPPPTVCLNGLYADISNQHQVQQSFDTEIKATTTCQTSNFLIRDGRTRKRGVAQVPPY